MSTFDHERPPAPSNPFETKATPPARKPAPPRAAGAKATGAPDGAGRDLAYASPWSDEVDGVPTHNVAHPDDGDAQITTESGGTKYGNDKKKRQKFTDANHTVERTRTTKTTEGDVTDTDEKKVGVTVNKKGGSVTQSRTKEHKIGEGDDAITSKSGASRGVEVSGSGAGVKLGNEVEVTSAGGKYQGSGSEVSAGYEDGHVKAELKKTKKHGTADVGHEEEQSVGLSEGRLTVGTGKKTEYKRKETVDGEEVEKKSSRGSSTSFGVGTDSVAASHTRTQTSEDGTQRSVSVGGTLNADGTGSVNAGYTRTTKDGDSISVSVKAGVTVECSEPREVDGKWHVVYKRTNSVGGGAGGSSHGVGVSASGSKDSYDTGTRTFKTKEEADDFRANAAERVPSTPVDPKSLFGALTMPIGETLGRGEALTGQLGASLTVEGATLGVSGKKQDTEEFAVTRVSPNLFDVTVSRGNLGGKDFTLSGLGIGLSRGDSDSAGSSVTLRFDLATPLGVWAYQYYCQTRIIPMMGCKIMAVTASKGEESHEGVSVGGLLDDTHQRRSYESETVDADGKHEEYGGEKSHVVKGGRIAHWLGDKDITEINRLVGQQHNDKISAYRFEAVYGGESGKTNRKNLAFLSRDHDDKGARSDDSSGEWRVSADISPAQVKKMLEEAPHLEKIKDPDEQMRALSEYVKTHGAGAARAIEGLGGKSFAWDLELKGDPNFPGKAGRLAIDKRVAELTTQMLKDLKDPQGTVSAVQKEMDKLAARRAAVADPAKYPDLPDGLRAQQLELIDAEIAQFAAVRHLGAVELTKRRPGEDPEAAAKRQGDEHGYDDVAPGPQRELARLRDEIAVLDGKLAAGERKNHDARRAIKFAMKHHTDAARVKQAARGARKDQADQLLLGELADDRHVHEALGAVDDLRMQFICNLPVPEHALMYGRSLRDKLQQQLALVDEAAAHLRASAVLQATMNDDKSLAGKHGAYWAEIEDGIDVEEFRAKPKEDPFARPNVSMQLP